MTLFLYVFRVAEESRNTFPNTGMLVVSRRVVC